MVEAVLKPAVIFLPGSWMAHAITDYTLQFDFATDLPGIVEEPAATAQIARELAANVKAVGLGTPMPALNSASERAPQPDGFTGELYPYQLAALAAMRRLEAVGAAALGRLAPGEGRLRPAGGARCALRIASGKTLVVLALAAGPPPPPQPAIVIADGVDKFPMLGWLPARGFAPTTMVVAAPALLSQWAAEAARWAPRLRVAVVADARSLTVFTNAVAASRALPELVLVKAGTASVRAPGARVSSLQWLPSVVADMLGGAVARVIVDDFDTLPSGSGARVPPASFIWLVSATCRRGRSSAGEHGRGLSGIRHDLIVSRADAGAVADPNATDAGAGVATGAAAAAAAAAATDEDEGERDSQYTLGTYVLSRAGIPFAVVSKHPCVSLSIDCSPEFIAEGAAANGTSRVGVTRYRRAVVEGGRAAAFAEALGANADVLELAAGGAWSAAAAEAGLAGGAAEGAAGLIVGLMGRHSDRAREALAVLAAAEAARRAYAAGQRAPAPAPAPGSAKSKEALAQLRSAIADGDVPLITGLVPAAVIAAGASATLATIETAVGHASESLAAARAPLERLRARLAEDGDDCACCGLPIADAAECAAPDTAARYLMAACCQISICGDCIAPRGRRIQNCVMCGAPAAGIIRIVANIGDAIESGFQFLAGNVAAGFAAAPVAPVDTAPVDTAADAPVAADDGDDDAAPAADADGDAAAVADGAAAAVADAAAAVVADGVAAAHVPTADDFNAGIDLGIRGKLAVVARLIAAEPAAEPGDECAPFATGLAGDGPLGAGAAGGTGARVLIYARHAETMRLLERELAILGVMTAPLRGTRAQRDVAVATFKNVAGRAPRVLLVADARDCAGLHLPEISHVVFFHRVEDAAVRAQVVGRAARPGRTRDLIAYELLDEFENGRL